MGLLDDLKHKAEELGDKAKEGFDAAKDKAGDVLGDAGDKAGHLVDDARHRAGDLVDDVRERFGHHDASAPLSESSDVSADAPDAGSAAATGAGADVDEADEAANTNAPDAAEPVVESDVDPYDEPLTETIGDEIAADPVDERSVADAVGSADRSDQT